MKRKVVDIRWLNMDRGTFQTRESLEAYAQRHEGGTWQAKVDDDFKPGILIAYGQRAYSRKIMLTLDKELRRFA